jgi:Metallopeptidase family M24
MLKTMKLEHSILDQLDAEGRLLEPNAFVPEIPRAVYEARAAHLDAAREAAGLEGIVIYADREHAANLAWLTGFSPRFEEALLIAMAGKKPLLLVGNENLEYARHAVTLEGVEIALYPHFSLPDQDRSQHRDLRDHLRHAGVTRGARIGAIGWKPGSALEDGNLELPHFIVAALEAVTGELPTNAAGLLMHAETGLRATLEPEMIVFAEYAARLTSQAVLRVVSSLKTGMTERAAAGLLNAHGLELSCHPMTNFAPVIHSGLGSPRNRVLTRGDYAQLAMGVIGSLTCRAGRVVTSGDADADEYDALLGNYLRVVRAWYAALHVGASGGDVVQAVESVRSSDWQLALNPGHLLHLDEWMGSPFTPNSVLRLRSGMALQQDLIPVPAQSRAAINMEDGLILADADLRATLEQLDPALTKRCTSRRDAMQRLGYELHEDVLPLSDIAGAMMPYLLEPDVVALVG